MQYAILLQNDMKMPDTLHYQFMIENADIFMKLTSVTIRSWLRN